MIKDFIHTSKLLIFDLDGTLYEDTSHFDYYAKLLMNKLAKGKQEQFWEEYISMKQGNHVVSVGKGYNIHNDCLLTIDPMDNTILKVCDWNGKEWRRDNIQKKFGSTIVFDFENTIAIGDGWWLPYVTALHYGITDVYSSYQETKEYMVTDAFHLQKTPRLLESLMELKDKKKLLLVSNSDKEDVTRLLRQLDLFDMFLEIIPSAEKPANTKEHFTYILKKYEVSPAQAVSIGDNFINDIAPALKLGMKAIFISAHNTADKAHNQLLQVNTLANAFD